MVERPRTGSSVLNPYHDTTNASPGSYDEFISRVPQRRRESSGGMIEVGEHRYAFSQRSSSSALRLQHKAKPNRVRNVA